MKFVVSTTTLLSHLQAISRVIAPKNTLPILDNFLITLAGNELTATATDLETTLTTKLEIENSDGEGSIAIPAKIINETLKEFPEQPLTFEIDFETYGINIFSENGKFSIVGQDAADYPEVKEIKEESATTVTLPADVLESGVVKTLFATGDDELRQVMNGIFFEIHEDYMSFVASDAHKLVKYIRNDVKAGQQASFILPKKPAGLLKNILAKEENDVVLKFDEENAFFTLTKYTMICRLTEGKYPNYDSVIPKDFLYNMTIDRVMLYNSLRRVSLFSNQASNLVKLKLENNQVVVSAQDIDFSISALENINCQYEGEPMELGYKSTFLVEMLNNMTCTDVVFKLSEPSRAAVLVPYDKDIEAEDELMLIMPLMLTSA